MTVATTSLLEELAAKQGPMNPRPTGGDLYVDVRRGIIYGVLLLSRRSTNGYDYSEQAIRDAQRLAHRSKVQEGHYPRHGAAHLNGQVRDPYRDGKDLRGAWHLNMRNPNSEQYLLDALEFPENLVLSIETLKKDSPTRLNPRTGSQEVTTIKAIQWFAVENDGGVARSLSHRRFERNQRMSDSPKTARELRRMYPELVAEIENECARRVEADCNCKSEDAIATLTRERDEMRDQLDHINAERERNERIAAIRKEWSDLLGDIKPEQLPERLRNLLALKDDEIELFLKQEPLIVTSTLTTRAEAIKESARTIEANISGGVYPAGDPAPAYEEPTDYGRSYTDDGRPILRL